MSDDVRCPGCAGKMKVYVGRESPDRPYLMPKWWCYFQCECGWRSPTKYAASGGDAFEKAFEVATHRTQNLEVER